MLTPTDRPVPTDVERVLAPAVYPDALEPGVRVDGRCGLGAAILPFTPEDVAEVQPVSVDALTVVLAGRLDNRDELYASLGVAVGSTDARLAARAYQKWGLDCPDRLIGGFALLVWDSARDRLFAATDHLATRSLFYAERPAGFVIASTIRQVRASGWVPDELDEGYLLASVCLPAGAPLPSVRTPYVGINRLLGGSALVVERRSSARTWRYWKPEELPEATGDVDELGEQLRERLTIAVRAQARSRGRVMCTLSGGLDSSTVTGLVARMAHENSLPCKGFEAMSLRFDKGTEADESEYLRYAERAYGIEASRIDGGECWHFRDIGPDGTAPLVDEPFVSHAAYGETREFAEAARKADCDVVLFGNGGDELMSGSEYFLADLLRSGRLLRTWRRGRELAGLSNRTYASSLSRLAIGPIRASAASARSDRAGVRWEGLDKDWDSYWYRPPAPPWLLADEARRAVVQQIWRETTTLGIRPYARAHEMSWIRAAGVLPALNDSAFYPRGLEKRAPFYDRRVVELALSIPGAMKLKVVDGNRVTKLVLRAATRDLLPEPINQRTTKASLSAGSADGLSREWARIWNDGRLQVVERGLVDGDQVSRALRAARMGQWENIAHLTSLVVLEFWLRGIGRTGGR